MEAAGKETEEGYMVTNKPASKRRHNCEDSLVPPASGSQRRTNAIGWDRAGHSEGGEGDIALAEPW